jgi:hypothetical protein
LLLDRNINKLGSILDFVNEDYGISIDGVNTAYLYFGMWKSCGGSFVFPTAERTESILLNLLLPLCLRVGSGRKGKQFLFFIFFSILFQVLIFR